MAQAPRNPPETPTAAAPQAIEAAPPPVPAVIVPPEVTDYVAQWVIAGHSPFVIEQGVAAMFPDYRVEDVCRAVLDHFIRQGSAPPAFRLGECVEMTREIYRVAMLERKFDRALEAVKLLARLTK